MPFWAQLLAPLRLCGRRRDRLWAGYARQNVWRRAAATNSREEAQRTFPFEMESHRALQQLKAFGLIEPVGVRSVRAERPVAPVEHRYKWRLLIGFAHPASGCAVFDLATSVSIPLFEVDLAAFARQVEASPKKKIVLVLDRAGWHTSLRVCVPDHIYLHFLPPYSPEVQQRSTCGRSPTHHSSTAISPASRSRRKRKPTAASRFRSSHPTFARPPSSTGGLSASASHWNLDEASSSA
jgi:hypothetical protein